MVDQEIKGTEITKDLVDKINKLLNYGLVKGMGSPQPGHMCVEAVVCYALGEPHGDRPSCVQGWLANLKIKLNDLYWLSDKHRAEGLRRLAIAQLGTKEMDLTKAYVNIYEMRTCNCDICLGDLSMEERLEYIEFIVQELIKAGTPGSKFL
jgi:hypothetical protein